MMFPHLSRRSLALAVLAVISGLVIGGLAWKWRGLWERVAAAGLISEASTVDENAAECPACHGGFVPQVVEVPAVQPASTKRMVERLEAEWRKAARHPTGAGAYMSAELAEHVRFKIETEPDPRLKLPMLPNLSVQLLNAGKSEEALQVLDEFEEEAKKLGVRVSAQWQTAFTMHRALCYLRIGEQENCLTNHNADSCLLPVQGGGIHRLPRGSQAAVELLTAHLRENRNDLQARWLLNIAHMTLGDYPDTVAGGSIPGCLSPSMTSSGFRRSRRSRDWMSTAWREAASSRTLTGTVTWM